jgi:pimeloyl-ACP methyl ester carboxylesterase
MSFHGQVTMVSVLSLVACGGRPGPAAPSGAATFPSGDVQLSYALDLPPVGRGPFPALVFGHGSGRVTKDAALPLSWDLTAAGYAVLRYDKRGVGGSGGTYQGVSVPNSDQVLGLLAQDMAAGVAFLASRPEIDARRIGLIGGSQAGWVMPLAARRGGVRFMVLLSSPTVSVGEEIFYSELAEDSSTSFDDLSAALQTFTGPRGYDPRPHLLSLDVPGLWVLGADDRSIPTRETVAILADLAAGGKPYRWKVYENAGHSLTDARTGALVDFLPDVLRFLAAH